MPFRVRNKTTKAEYTTARVAEDEEIIEGAETVNDVGRFLPPVYPEEALQATPEPEPGVFTPDTVIAKTDDSPTKAPRSGRR